MSVVTQNPIAEKLNSMLSSYTVKGADAFRAEAKKALQNCDLPNTKNEDWKYTRITKAVNSDFKNETGALPDLSDFLQYKDVLVFVNGRFNFEISKIHNTKFKFTNAGELTALPFYNHSKNYFTALNGTFFTTGILADEENEKAAIVHFISGNTFSNMHHVLKSRKGKSSSYDLFFISDESANFSNLVVQAEVEENASLNINVFQNEKTNTSSVNLVHVYQHKNSKFSINTISAGGNITRNDLNIVVDGENCESHLNGVYVPSGTQHIDNHTLVDHRKPHCVSNEKYKGIMNDTSSGVFNGKVFVRQDAQKINAYQSNQNILLSDEAIINSKPELEIYADDVKCSHGSTTGQLDDEAMFYLRARGIGKESAKKLLVQAFLIDVIDMIDSDNFKSMIEQEINQKLK
jgi:Fe-S cluster assembly protein SufD